MAEPATSPDPGNEPDTRASSLGELVLSGIGLVYLAAGLVFGTAYVVGGVTSSLFPTGWIFPVILIITGGLMAARRRFDIVATLWGALTLAVFLLDMDIYMRGLDLRLVDPAAFDPTLIVGVLALVVLVLRPRFRD
jgi:hypothetical protein